MKPTDDAGVVELSLKTGVYDLEAEFDFGGKPPARGPLFAYIKFLGQSQ